MPPTEPLELYTAADMSPSHTIVSNSKGTNVPSANHIYTKHLHGSIDVTHALTPTWLFHTSSQPLTDTLPEHSTSKNMHVIIFTFKICNNVHPGIKVHL